MNVISWEQYESGTGDQGLGTREYNSNNYIASVLNSDSSNRNPLSPSLALTVGVFDGIHLGHQSLIKHICAPIPALNSPSPAGLSKASPLVPHTGDNNEALAVPPHSSTSLDAMLKSWHPTVVTFTQNPLKILNPEGFAGDICTLEQKMRVFEELGVQLTVLIDFSLEFSKINGRDFIDLLLTSRPVKLIAFGRNFRCGHGLDTGVEEIRSLAAARGTETWVAEPVMDSGQPVSSSRIRQALAAGRMDEAERLLGRPLNNIPNRR